MQFILSSGWEEGIAELTAKLVKELAAGKKVLWLVSGGSNIQASVQIMENISAEPSQGLSVMLADERYGEPGHETSNWAQLIAAGFEAKQAGLLPVLRPDQSFESATVDYDRMAEQAFSTSDVVVAQLGIGDDGHIAGILPNSVATQETDAWVVGYEAPPLRRLTLSFTALRRIDQAYAFAFGELKKSALVQLKHNSLPLAEQPSQILKQLPAAIVFNDQVGD